MGNQLITKKRADGAWRAVDRSPYFVASFVGDFVESERNHESHDTKQKVKFAASSREFARKWI